MMQYDELVKALRHCNGPSFLACRECQYNNNMLTCPYKMLRDAAAAIEALQAELEKKRTADCWGCKCEKLEPKLGEWIRVREVDIPGEMHPVAFRCMCSTCRNEYVFPRIPQYCPDCGSRNTAKMEVQE